MKKTNYYFKNHANLIASLAMAFCVIAANSRCVCIYHQPKMPDGLQKLKKG